jgi:anion-transporting  ArsA/GET3 family ATPase
MRFERFCSSRVVIVAGKGGVGKTTVTAALAVTAARTGASVLIVEVEGKSGLAAAFDRPPLTYEQVALEPGIEARTLTPDEALLEYLDEHGMRRISRRMARVGVLDLVATAVPGMKDILVLGKVKQLERASDAPDLVILDAPAAGHAVRFLLSPRGLLDAVSVGPISKQATEVVEMLDDPSRCQVMLVTIPEETPVTELVETAYALEDRAGVALGPVVVNGCYEPLDAEVSSEADRLRADAAVLGGLDDRMLDEIAAAATFRARRARVQRIQAERLAAALPLRQLRLPFLFSADLGRAEIGVLADALAEGIDRLPERDVA